MQLSAMVRMRGRGPLDADLAITSEPMEEAPVNAGPSSMIFASIYIDTRPVWRSYARTLTTAGRCLRAVPGCVCR
jgi:hypothetical protein